MSDKATEISFSEIIWMAVPAFLVTKTRLARIRQRKGLTVRKVEVRVGEFVVDAYLFRRGRQLTPKSLFSLILEVAGLAPAAFGCEQCVWKDKLIPFLVTKTAKVSIHEDPNLSAEEKGNQQVAVLKYAEILARLSRITGGMKFHFHCDGEEFVMAPYWPGLPNAIHVFLNAAPPGNSSTRYVSQAFGLQLKLDGHHMLSAGPTRGRGLVLGDGEQSLVQILGNNIYFLIPTISYYNVTTSPVLFEKLLALAWRGYRESLGKEDEERPEIGRSEFVRVTEEWAKFSLNWYEERVGALDKRIGELRTELATHHRLRQEYAGMIEAFSSSAYSKETQKRLPLDYRKIKAEPDVAHISIVDDSLQVETRGLVLEHNGECYLVGAYTIGISKFGEVSVWSERPLHPNGIPHPHIAKDGGPCFGNATDAITKAAANHKYYDAIFFILRWLKHGYTPELTAVKIEEWPRDLSTKREVAHA